jgi:hypothetical protein
MKSSPSFITEMVEDTWSEVFSSWNQYDAGFEYAGTTMDIWAKVLIDIPSFDTYIKQHVEMSFVFRDARNKLVLLHHIKKGTEKTYYGFQGNKMTTPPVEFDITPNLFHWKQSPSLATDSDDELDNNAVLV